MSRTIQIGTRGSELALAQARLAAGMLESAYPAALFELVTIRTRGDRSPGPGNATRVGVGDFVREIESALLDGRVDLAVHSLKDVPTECAPGTIIAAVPERAAPHDVLVSREGLTLAALPPGSRVGTMSARRRAQLLRARPDLEPVPIRGNVDTRLRKLDSGQDGLAGIIIAAAGLDRLGRSDRVTEALPASAFLPAAGQGALAVQARADDEEALELAGRIDDRRTRLACEAERLVISMLGCGCRTPVGVYGRTAGDMLELAGAVLSVGGEEEIRGEVSGPSADAESLAGDLAEGLLERGAKGLIDGARGPGE